MLRDAMDARFEERKADILQWIRGGLDVPPAPPDGGPPEPGTPPPAGPHTIEEAEFLGDNPWILYWFVSLKAPMLLDVIDAHLMRRLGELGFEQR